MMKLSAMSVPRLPHGVRLKFDRVRDVCVLLAPERAFELDGVAAEVLSHVNGARRIGEIVDVLAARFAADRTIVEADVIEMLADLVGRRVLEVDSEDVPSQVEQT
jgi:pyrroloquinoline quinone biosynthesis protein D